MENKIFTMRMSNTIKKQASERAKELDFSLAGYIIYLITKDLGGNK